MRSLFPHANYNVDYVDDRKKSGPSMNASVVRYRARSPQDDSDV